LPTFPFLIEFSFDAVFQIPNRNIISREKNQSFSDYLKNHLPFYLMLASFNKYQSNSTLLKPSDDIWFICFWS